MRSTAAISVLLLALTSLATAGDRPKVTAVATSGGEVSVATPAGEGWTCAPREAKRTPENAAWMVKCNSAEPGAFFFMIAKVYTVPAADVQSAEKLVREVYPSHYGKLFATHRIEGVSPATLAGHAGLKYDLHATHAGRGEIRKHERVFVVGNRIHVLSAEGNPETYAKHAAAIAAWFDSATFGGLEPAAP